MYILLHLREKFADILEVILKSSRSNTLACIMAPLWTFDDTKILYAFIVTLVEHVTVIFKTFLWSHLKVRNALLIQHLRDTRMFFYKYTNDWMRRRQYDTIFHNILHTFGVQEDELLVLFAVGIPS